jgi:hypothetical protein
MERLLRRGELSVIDVEEVYAGIFLDIFTEFEALIEALFLGLVSRELRTVINPVTQIVTIKPAAKIREIVFSGKSYLDWLPYTDYTIPRAKMYFADGKPFSLLTVSQKDSLKSYHLIRNALAHKSDSATKKFSDMISSLPLLPNEKTPCGYLRSIPGVRRQTQYEIAVINLQLIAKSLCA